MKRERRDHEPLRLTFRGAVLSRRKLARIRELVDAGQGRSRQELAREVCRTFGWRCSNGAWAVRATRQLLVRLDKLGVLRLPPPRRAQGRPRREAVESAAALLSPAATSALAGSSARSDGTTLRVRPIAAAEWLGWRAHMERFHGCS